MNEQRQPQQQQHQCREKDLQRLTLWMWKVCEDHDISLKQNSVHPRGSHGSWEKMDKINLVDWNEWRRRKNNDEIRVFLPLSFSACVSVWWIFSWTLSIPFSLINATNQLPEWLFVEHFMDEWEWSMCRQFYTIPLAYTTRKLHWKIASCHQSLSLFISSMFRKVSTALSLFDSQQKRELK